MEGTLFGFSLEQLMYYSLTALLAALLLYIVASKMIGPLIHGGS